MTWPARSSTCDHLQCFDAALYLMMNERKPKWLCPVCNKMAFFDNLQIDGFFKEVSSLMGFVLCFCKLSAFFQTFVMTGVGKQPPTL